MTKLMAFDLDGTILFNRAVDPATEQAIARWQAEGNLAVSCTGKSIFAAQLALNPTAIRFDYHVLYTGAVITDRQYRVIYHQPLPGSIVQACYEHFSTAASFSYARDDVKAVTTDCVDKAYEFIETSL